MAGITDEALSLLMAYRYPGNVRELENAIEHAFVLCREGEIQPKHLPEHIWRRSVVEMPQQGRGGEIAPLAAVEADFLRNALERHNYNCRETAESLGMHKTTLYRKIKRLGIGLPATDRG